jgi:methylated-DNA-[protein]-cysteine S-methyltransferase
MSDMTNDTKMLERRLRSLTTGAAAMSKRASAGLGDAAATEGLLDLAYGFTDSPVGRLLVVQSPHGVVRIEFAESIDDALQELAANVSPRLMESNGATGETRRELDEYFDGRRRDFDSPVDLSAVRGFARKVLDATARIPFGSVSTYRDVAGRAGNARAMRAAGNALGSNPVPIVVPCHRVIRTDGSLGGYGGRLDRKVVLLRLEGALQED